MSLKTKKKAKLINFYNCFKIWMRKTRKILNSAKMSPKFLIVFYKTQKIPSK